MSPQNSSLTKETITQGARTSETHPLVFDTLKIGRGLVMMTICPGEKRCVYLRAPVGSQPRIRRSTNR